MSSSQTTVDYILEQIAGAGRIWAKKMFGEYGLYCNDKIVAFVCDDQLFVKPTLPGRDFIIDLVEGYPYPGAKPYFLISGELWDDAEWMAMLIKITSEALPLPPTKNAKGKA